jgi:short-subunit dehydrogenase|tara:strand:- start:999 stop:1823 length:825 start_codon:yes stop_codon:yes gene_type:complete
MYIYDKKTVLVTGASTGIGYALAKELAKKGSKLILTATARSEDKLHMLANDLKSSGSEAHVFIKDLSIIGAAEELFNEIKSTGLDIDLLINNAGYGRWGELTSIGRDDYASMIQLNIVALTDLCHLCIPDMISKGGGGIINVGSMASLSPIPYAGIYSSSKAYVLMFSEAIRYEYQSMGIQVMALLPGGTESEFARVATEKSEKLTRRNEKRTGSTIGMQTSKEVAIEGLAAFKKNKQFILCGRNNRLLFNLTKFMTRKSVLNFTGNMFKKIAG